MNKKLLSTVVLLLSTILVFAQSGIEIPAKLKDRPEVVIRHAGYTISYNIAHGTPNWSAWVLTKSHTSTSSAQVQRTNQFLPDSLVPIAYRVQPSDYTNSGYDRGHMCFDVNVDDDLDYFFQKTVNVSVIVIVNVGGWS